jgi:serine protease Do
MWKKSLVGGTLVALGAAGAITAMHVRVGWGPTAAAAPPVVAAEAKAALPPPTPNQLNEARSLSRTFAQVASQLSPSVVRISITKTMKGRRMTNPFERFFGEPDRGGEEGSPGPKQRGTGSGVVIDQRGYILTNNHVVEDADEVKVSFIDGKTVDGKVIGTDPKSDLAVVKVNGVDVKSARLGDSDAMQIGEWVIAIGNPFGLDHTVTVGVLSAKNRSGFQSGHYEDFLQTDASINPGNSGGPLVNLDGEVVGINTMIAGIGTGIGFAVPSSMARPIVDQLINGGKVRRPYLGIYMQDVTPEMAKGLGGKAPEKGALVSQVQPGSPAEKAGVKPGDVIERVDGQPVDGSKSVQKTVLSKKIGQKIDLELWRDGKSMKLSPTATELPGEEKQAANEGKSAPKVKLGLGLQSMSPAIAERLGVDPHTRGAVVTSVREGSPAQDAGLREGDLIVEVDRHAVSSSEDAVKLLSSDRAGGHLVRMRRGDAALFVVIPSS